MMKIKMAIEIKHTWYPWPGLAVGLTKKSLRFGQRIYRRFGQRINEDLDEELIEELKFFVHFW